MSLLRLCGAAIAATVLTACALEHDHDHDPAAMSAAFERAFEEQMDEGKADGPGCSGVRVPDRGPFDMRIALTFDDGPNPETTPKVMSVLRGRDIPATFFINGRRVVDDETRAIVREIAADPLFELANHSWSHPNIATLAPGEVASQIDRTTTVIREAGATPRYFRFPFGSSTCATAARVRERDYVVTGWHVDSADWCFAGNGGVCPERAFRYVPDQFRENMLGYVLDQAAANGGGILLFHDIHRYTADSLEGIIESLEAAGFTFTNLDDLTVFPELNGIEAPFIGDTCAGDEDCAPISDGYCHGAGFCTVACSGYCADGAGISTFCIQDDQREAGICVPKADGPTACEAVPNTRVKALERYVGQSGAPSRTAQVCSPF